MAGEPMLFVSATESWTDITVRYLVGARERRKWSSIWSRRTLALTVHA